MAGGASRNNQNEISRIDNGTRDTNNKDWMTAAKDMQRNIRGKRDSAGTYSSTTKFPDQSEE